MFFACEEIRRFGAGRATVVSIAAAAGMTHANVYRYFPSKTALFDAVSTDWLKRLEDMLRNISDAPDPAHDKLERMVLSLARAYRDKAEAETAVFELFAGAFLAGRQPPRRHRARLAELFGRVIEEGASTGGFLLPASRAASLIFDGLYRFLSPAAVLNDRDQSWNAMEKRMEQVLRGLLAVLRHG